VVQKAENEKGNLLNGRVGLLNGEQANKQKRACISNA